MAKKTETKTEKIEREYVIPIRDKIRVVPRYKKTNKAIKIIKEFLARHMKIYDRDLNKIKIDKYLNEFIWSRGIRNPPHKIKVKVIKDSGKNEVKVELVDYPDKIKFKKLRAEKIKREAKEQSEKKKSMMEKAKEGMKKPEETEGGVKKEEAEKEKKAAVVEAGKEIEKEAAKKAKHETKSAGKTSKQKHQQRKALAK